MQPSTLLSTEQVSKLRLPLRSQLPRSSTNKSVAEAALKQEAAKPQYSLSLLNIVNSDSLPINTRLAAALAFKNFIRYNYVVRPDNRPS